MKEPTALVFDIEKFAVHDGPGIRTVVFLKGCPLRCRWCHNPESQSFAPELLFSARKCTFCGKCAGLCPEHCHTVTAGKHLFHREKCRVCGACAAICPAGAPELVGKEMTVGAVMAELLKDKPFYDNSGGGITLSGGEPLAHFGFTSALLRAAKEAGLHTALETSGFAPREKIEALLPLTDLWLWDVKAPPGKHLELTGVPAEPILENLKIPDRHGAAVILRCPLVPGVNDDEEALLHIAALAEDLKSLRRIDLEPYHPLGEGKGADLGRKTPFHAPTPSEADRKRWLETVRAHTRVPVRI